ncbi:MAG: hypothetical protein ACKPKO_31660, partial [Candidatus Fonsibacter sp.]
STPDNNVCATISPNITLFAFYNHINIHSGCSKLVQIILLAVVESVRTNEAVARRVGEKRLKALVVLLYCIRPL